LLVLVYHDPGSDAGPVLSLAERVGARAVRISELSRAEISPQDSVVLLMPMRGGHYLEVQEVVRSRGARFRRSLGQGVRGSWDEYLPRSQLP